MIRKYKRVKRKSLMSHEPQPSQIELKLEMPDRLFEMIKYPNQALLHPRIIKHYIKYYDYYVRWGK